MVCEQYLQNALDCHLENQIQMMKNQFMHKKSQLGDKMKQNLKVMYFIHFLLYYLRILIWNYLYYSSKTETVGNCIYMGGK